MSFSLCIVGDKNVTLPTNGLIVNQLIDDFYFVVGLNLSVEAKCVTFVKD